MNRPVLFTATVSTVILMIMSALLMSSGVTAQTSCPPANCKAGREVGRDYFVQVVGHLKDVPVSDFAVDALVAWQPYENTLACWNPLATTRKMDVVCYFNCLPGQRDAAGNCIMGVQHYQNQDMGVQATANTLNQGDYNAIRRMLRLENFDREGLRAALGTWGTCKGQRCDPLLKDWQGLWDARCGGLAYYARTDTSLIPVFLLLTSNTTVQIKFTNTGSKPWLRSEVALVNTNGQPLGANPRNALAADTVPGGVASFDLQVNSPAQAGVFLGEWQLERVGQRFGPKVTITLTVAPKEAEAWWDQFVAWVQDTATQFLRAIAEAIRKVLEQ